MVLSTIYFLVSIFLIFNFIFIFYFYFFYFYFLIFFFSPQFSKYFAKMLLSLFDRRSKWV